MRVRKPLETILEEDLPARFGGGPLDYQLVEDEDEVGIPRLTLFIEPNIAIDDEAAVVQHLLESAGSTGEGTAVLIEAGSISVRRAQPILTQRGKFMPLQLLGRPGSA